MSNSLQNEYVKISSAIENIQTKINQYKHKIKSKIENTKDENEKLIYIEEFRNIVKSIKEDHEIMKKYKILKKRQYELKTLLFSKNSRLINENENNKSETFQKTIYKLMNKYKNENVKVISCANSQNMHNDNLINILGENTKQSVRNIENSLAKNNLHLYD